MTRMSPRVFEAIRERDGYRCVAGCGDTETLIPGHRIGRGMGGSKLRERPSNVVTMCSRLNDLVETKPAEADRARAYGWKLRPWDDPATEPVYDVTLDQWFLLDDDFGRVVTTAPDQGS